MMEEQETLRLIKLAQQGDANALNDLVVDHSRLVTHILKNKFSFHKDQADLFQVGVIGLIRSIKSFKLNSEFKFSTYSGIAIVNSIFVYLRNDGTIRISRNIRSLNYKIKRETNNFIANNSRYPNFTELCEIVDAPRYKIVEALNYKIKSIDERISGLDGEDITLMEVLKDSKSEFDFNNIILMNAVDSLPERHKKIIYYKYFQNKTQMEIAKILGFGQVQISKNEKQAIEMLREYMGVDITKEKSSRQKRKIKVAI